MKRKCLVLGGNGFIGYTVTKELVRRGIMVRSVDKYYPDDKFRITDVEYCTGDVWDRSFLGTVLDDVETIYDFIATTMPNTNDISLENEIDNTLRYHNYILSLMNDKNIGNYVFPSSGGAIYGNTVGFATEDDNLMPTTPYGVGKQISEEIIKYYAHKCGINAYIFRIGNVYGSTTFRKKPQGVVDIFIQRALQNKPIIIWGNAENVVRDYVYLEDVASTIVEVTAKPISGVETYNIGTGKGTCLKDLIRIIEREIGHHISAEYKADMASGIDSIVLSPEKIFRNIGKRNMLTLEDGIKKTIGIKRQLMGE